MKIYNSTREAHDAFLSAKKLPRNLSDQHYKLYNSTSHNLKFGDWILYEEIIDSGQNITKPQFGIFVGYTMWDMALVHQIVNKPRAYQNHCEVMCNPELKYTQLLAFFDAEVNQIEDWNNGINIMLHSKTKPTIAEMKKAIIEHSIYNQIS